MRIYSFRLFWLWLTFVYIQNTNTMCYYRTITLHTTLGPSGELVVPPRSFSLMKFVCMRLVCMRSVCAYFGFRIAFVWMLHFPLAAHPHILLNTKHSLRGTFMDCKLWDKLVQLSTHQLMFTAVAMHKKWMHSTMDELKLWSTEFGVRICPFHCDAVNHILYIYVYRVCLDWILGRGHSTRFYRRRYFIRCDRSRRKFGQIDLQVGANIHSYSDHK